MQSSNTPLAKSPKLLDQVRDRIRVKHCSIRTKTQYVQWVRHFILFHGKKHPGDMGALEVEALLTHLAVEGNVAAATQNQALSPRLFLDRDVSTTMMCTRVLNKSGRGVTRPLGRFWHEVRHRRQSR